MRTFFLLGVLALALIEVPASGSASEEKAWTPAEIELMERRLQEMKTRLAISPPGQPPITYTPRHRVEGDEARQTKLVELRKAKSRWDSSAPSSYRFSIARVCLHCRPRRVTVHVDNSRVVSTEHPRTGEEYETQPWFTVDWLFSYLHSALGDAQEVTVKYDTERGFPAWISVDHTLAVRDDEVTYEIKDFTCLTQGNSGNGP